MSAGLRPEGFDIDMDDIREVSAEILQMLSDNDRKLAIPALIMSIVTVAKEYSEDYSRINFEVMIGIIHDGIDAAAKDFIREELKNGN
jgi:hypothetical protein